MDTCLVKLDKVYKYDVKTPYDLEIHEKDCILVSGDNGKGKTTLTKLILGYINPDRGFVYKKPMKIGYLPEHIEFPLFMKVNRYIDLLSKIKEMTDYETLVYQFKLPLFKSIYQLSHGNRQKLGILSACMGHPELIIFDEPLAALDQEGRMQFYQLIEYLKTKNHTILMITHFPDMLKPLCNKHITL
ncbi:MAG: ATP-binding cassette domain-containing protein [Acholeplasmataceae bacterium]